MNFKAELVKSIWYAFSALDVEQSGKVSMSQLKVLSHNLHIALNIPLNLVTLEEHFQEVNNGLVSSLGYMTYLNEYILAKIVIVTNTTELESSVSLVFKAKDILNQTNVELEAKEGTFNRETFDELCWTMAAKKNLRLSMVKGVCSPLDNFRIFCLFNLLSEDHYPLVMFPSEVEYLVKKISAAMNQEWDEKLLDDLLSQDTSLQEGMSVWELLEHINGRKLLPVSNTEAFRLALEDVFYEMYHNVLKKGYMWKKGPILRNWTERWFVLYPSSISYYTGEDLKDKKGEIPLESCVVEPIPDKDGKRCLFCLKTPNRTYEISTLDRKQRAEWIQAVQTALCLMRERKSSLHQDLKLRRREQRKKSLHSQEDLLGEEAPKTQEEEDKEQWEVQRQLERRLKEVEKIKETLEVEKAMKEKEAEEQRKRINELEMTQKKLKEALNNEKQGHVESSSQLEPYRLLKNVEEKVKDEVREKNQQQQEEANGKHWSVQFNYLMKPISPGDHLENHLLKRDHTSENWISTSREFIEKYKRDVSQESHRPNCKGKRKELQEQLEAFKILDTDSIELQASRLSFKQKSIEWCTAGCGKQN